MSKHLATLITRMIEGTAPKLHTPIVTLMLPVTLWMNSALNSWKMRILPKSNPYELFQKLSVSKQLLKPSDIQPYQKMIKTKFNDQNLFTFRDVLRKRLNNNVSSIKEIKDFRNQLYVSGQHLESRDALKTLVEIQAKLYQNYKQQGMTQQMGQQLDLILIWINKFKTQYPEDAEMKEFKMNELSCMYEKVNLLKFQKNKKEYIAELEKLHKLELEQEESEDKQRRCNRVLRKICLHYLSQKEVKPILQYYNKVNSDSERRIIRHYLSDLV